MPSSEGVETNICTRRTIVPFRLYIYLVWLFVALSYGGCRGDRSGCAGDGHSRARTGRRIPGERDTNGRSEHVCTIYRLGFGLIQKYKLFRAALYPSYPTALEFSDAFGEGDFQQAVARYPERRCRSTSIFRSAISSATSAAAIKLSPVQRHKADQYLDALERKFASRAVVYWPSCQPASLGRRYANLSE